jgi:hypothetical protein
VRAVDALPGLAALDDLAGAELALGLAPRPRSPGGSRTGFATPWPWRAARRRCRPGIPSPRMARAVSRRGAAGAPRAGSRRRSAASWSPAPQDGPGTGLPARCRFPPGRSATPQERHPDALSPPRLASRSAPAPWPRWPPLAAVDYPGLRALLARTPPPLTGRIGTSAPASRGESLYRVGVPGGSVERNGPGPPGPAPA